MTVRTAPLSASKPQAAFSAAPAPLRLADAKALGATVADVHDHLQRLYATTRYDRLIYVEQMATARLQTPATPIAPAPLDCTDTARVSGAGHCAALARLLVEALPPAYRAFVAGGTLPQVMQQKGAPAVCHAAAVIGFVLPARADGDVPKDVTGHIVVDVGFGFAKPVVVFDDRPTVLPDGEGLNNTFSFDSAARVITCQPSELPGEAPWKPKKKRQHLRHYRTDVFDNVHAALTTPLAQVDRRLPIQARDATGKEVAALVVDCNSRRVVQRLHGERVFDASFAELQARPAATTSPWVDPQVARLLAQSPETLARRVACVMADADVRLGTGAAQPRAAEPPVTALSPTP